MKNLILFFVLCYGIQTIAMKTEYPSKLIECIKYYSTHAQVQPRGTEYSDFHKWLPTITINNSDLDKIHLSIEEDVSGEKFDIPINFFRDALTLYKTILFDKKSFLGNVCFNSRSHKLALVIDRKKLVIIDFGQPTVSKKEIVLDEETMLGYGDNSFVDFNHDESIVACATKNKILFYDTNSLAKINTLDTQNFTLKIKFSPNGKSLAVKNTTLQQTIDEGELVLYQYPSFEKKVLEDKFCKDFNFDSEGEKIIINDSSNVIYIYNTQDQKKSKIEPLEKSVNSCFIVDDNTYICAGSSDMYVIDVHAQKTQHCYSHASKNFSYDPIQNVILNAHNGALDIRKCDNLEANKWSEKLEGSTTADSVHVSRDGNYVATIEKEQSREKNGPRILIYNVPVFKETAEKLTPSRRNFAFFCEYWQKNNKPMPFKYHAHYDNLSDTLKPKFKNIFIKGEDLQKSNEKKLKKEPEGLNSRQELNGEENKNVNVQESQDKDNSDLKKPTTGFFQRLFNRIKSYIMPAAAVTGVTYLFYKYLKAPKKLEESHT